jgi:hypothetical protein
MKTRINLLIRKNFLAVPAWLPVLVLLFVFSMPWPGYAVSQGESLPSISVEIDNVPARVAAATIGEKIGYRVTLQSIDPEMKVSGRFTDSPVDAVLTRLLKGYNLAIMFDSKDRVITVQSLGKKRTPQGSDSLVGTDESNSDLPDQDSLAQRSASDAMADPDSLNGMVYSEKNDPLTGQSYEEIAAMHAKDKREREQVQLDPSIVDPMTGIPHAELKKLLEQ